MENNAIVHIQNLKKSCQIFLLMIVLCATAFVEAKKREAVRVDDQLAVQDAAVRRRGQRVRNVAPRRQNQRINRRNQPVRRAQHKAVMAPAQPVVAQQPQPAAIPLTRAHVDVTYGVSTFQNKRPYQEDRLTHFVFDNKEEFFAVYDGHGGDKTSSYLQQNMHVLFVECLKKTQNIQRAFECAFEASEKHALANFSDGSTAVIVYLDHFNSLHCAWVGDSRAVLEKNGGVGLATDDHKPDAAGEKKRIENAGGTVYMHGVWRVNGLAVSRSIGDISCKAEGKGQIVAVPEYKRITIDENNHFMILASDGLWDVMDNQDAIDLVKKELQKKRTLENIAQQLQSEAIKRGSQDNITICVMKFEWKNGDVSFKAGPKKDSTFMARFWNWWQGKK